MTVCWSLVYRNGSQISRIEISDESPLVYKDYYNLTKEELEDFFSEREQVYQIRREHTQNICKKLKVSMFLIKNYWNEMKDTSYV